MTSVVVELNLCVEHWWIDIDRESRRTWIKTCPGATLWAPNPIWIGPRWNLFLHRLWYRNMCFKYSSLLSYLLTYLLTYSMVQSPSWEANWFAASQEIPAFYGTVFL